MSSPVITRFAPSPTGYLHIGGARTALFNWAFSRNRRGKMLLRIEDTDRERSTAAAIDAIIEGLTWLGLDWEGEPVSQNGRAARHRQVAEELLAQGKAYRCYCTPQELEAMRAKAEAEKRPIRYDGTWRDRDPAEAPAGVKPVIRFKSPQEGETVMEDQVQGRVVIPNKDLDDLIILRSDGNPTYNLSVVVDDHDMGVTHIIRGVDHLTNAARQTQIYRAMGWRVPEMSHIPLIHGPDGAKLSKRHGALGVEAYRAMGYLPEAMRNYLARLGWSHGDDEIFSTEQLVEWFDLEHVGKSPARFDFAKLENLNGHYIRHTPDASLLAQFMDFLPHVEGGKAMHAAIDDAMAAKLLRAMPGLKERAKTLVELMNSSRYLFAARPLVLDEKAAALMADGGRAALAELIPVLEHAAEWTAPAL
jgi:glutamyl-tRNA synthetase